ncbi:hypothetical protein TWF730_010865 [Orbilia blumenaviensis]|uniref:Ubiquitin-protein ligase E3A N-terminal zinc-binding domain-containing protein n=1 Tax=Orbilia blumenaviensis TaxID=1796055 RepID=A0AAV9UJU7_9PEZI
MALVWSSALHLSPSTPPQTLTGDKLLLPQTALESLLSAAATAASQAAANQQTPAYDPASWDAPPRRNDSHQQQQQLPHPLTFRVTSLVTGRAAYAGIREFSADEGQVVLSNFLRESLALPIGTSTSSSNGSSPKPQEGDQDEDDVVEGPNGTRLKVEAVAIPKGTFARLRPLDAGYEEDWKPILENHLQKNFTTLAVNNILAIPRLSHQPGKDFKFLIDQVKPEGAEAICIVDTDLEVDIEPLNEEQAKESLRQRELRRHAESSSGGQINLDGPKEGTISDGNIVRFNLRSWDRSKPISISVPEEPVDILVSTDTMQGYPKLEEWTWARFDGSNPIVIPPDDLSIKTAKEVRISLQVYEQTLIDSNSKKPMPHPTKFLLSITQKTDQDSDEDEEMADAAATADSETCSNCKRSIPKRSMMLHQNFCFRNNILCRHGCGQVFKRGTELDHWHCTECKAFGLNTPEHDTYNKHMDIAHTARRCASCDYSAGSLSELAAHKTTTCAHKLILCRFCHLVVPQEEDTNFTAAITGLSPHETSCGGRTTNCHICERIVQLKNMEVHLKNHDLQRKSQLLPKICRNVNCTRTRTNDNQQIGLCSVCFGPLYSSQYDPTNQALARRAELRYLTQLLKGCGKPWCLNEMCKTGRVNRKPSLPVIPSKEATVLVKSLVTKEGLLGGYTSHPLHFCVDETISKRKHLAEMLSLTEDSRGSGGWAIEWCTKAVESVALEATDELDTVNKAREWLEKFGVKRDE